MALEGRKKGWWPGGSGDVGFIHASTFFHFLTGVLPFFFFFFLSFCILYLNSI